MSTTEPPDDSAPLGDPAPPDESAVVGDTPPSPSPEAPAPETPLPVAAPPAPSPQSDTWAASTSPTPTPLPPRSPTDSPVATDPWTAPAAKPKRRLTWLWVLLGILGLIAALVVVAVVLFVRTITGPIDATNAVLAQIKTEDYTEAYRLSCSEDRELYTVEQYAQAFRDTVAQRGAVESYDVNFSKVDGNQAEVRYDIEFRGGDTLRLHAKAHKEDGAWRVCLFSG